MYKNHPKEPLFMSISTNCNSTKIDTYFQEISYQISFNFLTPPSDHYARMFDYVVEQLNIDCLLQLCEADRFSGGRPPYNYRQLLKIFLFARRTDLSLRQINSVIKTNDNFKWFARDFYAVPSIATLCRFKSKLDIVNDEIMINFYDFMVKEDLIDDDSLYIDGTTFKAWNNRFRSYKEARVNEKIAELETEIACGNDSEECLKELDKQKKRLKILDGRTSCGSIDHDSIVLKDKRGHFMLGYNAQIITESKNSLIIGFDISSNQADNTDFIKTFEKTMTYTKTPKVILADAGYGTEENYDYLKRNNIILGLKPIDEYKEKKAKEENSKIVAENFQIVNNGKSLICPNNRTLEHFKNTQEKTVSGYIVNYSSYRSPDCSNCPLSKRCLNKKSNKEITISLKKLSLREEAMNYLESEEGKNAYNHRINICESSNGDIKQNCGTREFRRRGTNKVRTELMLSVIAHNIVKISNLK